MMVGLALFMALMFLGFEVGRRLSVRDAVRDSDRLRSTPFQKIVFVGNHPFVSNQLKDIAVAAGLQFEVADSPSVASRTGTLLVWNYRDSDSEGIKRYLGAPTHPTVLLVSPRHAVDLAPCLHSESVKMACYPSIKRNFLQSVSELSARQLVTDSRLGAEPSTPPEQSPLPHSSE